MSELLVKSDLKSALDLETGMSLDSREKRRDSSYGEHNRQTEEELQYILLQHQQWLRSDGEKGRQADLSCYDFRNIHLEDYDFSYAIIRNANFVQVNLNAVNFRNADLEGSVFTGAVLRTVNFDFANLKGCDFTNAKLLRSSLRLSVWQNAKLVAAQFHFCNLQCGQLTQADLSHASFLSSNLVYTSFCRSNLTNSSFTSLNLRSANFEEANMDRISLRHVKHNIMGLDRAEIERSVDCIYIPEFSVQ